MNPITEFNLEQGTYALFASWLKGHFDGAAHDIGGRSGVVFPRAALGFAQSTLPQPLNPVGAVAQVGITMVFTGPDARATRRWVMVAGSRQQLFYKPVRWNFWVRCETADDRSRALCLQAGQLLEGLLANASATRPLAQCGVHRLRPGTPVPVADNTYLLRQVPCAATLRYAVLSQGPDLPVLPDIGTVPTPVFPNTVRTGAAAPNGVLAGRPGDVYNQIVNGVFLQQWIKASGGDTTTGWQ